jgi:hypothetical protein
VARACRQSLVTIVAFAHVVRAPRDLVHIEPVHQFPALPRSDHVERCVDGGAVQIPRGLLLNLRREALSPGTP